MPDAIKFIAVVEKAENSLNYVVGARIRLIMEAVNSGSEDDDAVVATDESDESICIHVHSTIARRFPVGLLVNVTIESREQYEEVD